jgi:hypothetical protein
LQESEEARILQFRLMFSQHHLTATDVRDLKPSRHWTSLS